MKKRPCLMPVFLILLTCSHVMADGRSKDASVEACNALYHENSFKDAIGCYQSLSNSEHSANILYNIANSYAQLDQPGYSVLYYLRALSLNPGDSDISGNLTMIKTEKGLFPPEKSAVQRFFGLLTLGQWSILCLLSTAGYLIFACTRLRRPKNLVLETFVLLLCTILLSAGVFGAGYTL